MLFNIGVRFQGRPLGSPLKEVYGAANTGMTEGETRSRFKGLSFGIGNLSAALRNVSLMLQVTETRTILGEMMNYGGLGTSSGS